MRPYGFTPRSANIPAMLSPTVSSFVLSSASAFYTRRMTPAGSLMV
jgi:hypothetical protein